MTSGVSMTIGATWAAALANSPGEIFTDATVPSNGAMICALRRRICAASTLSCAVRTA